MQMGSSSSGTVHSVTLSEMNAYTAKAGETVPASSHILFFPGGHNFLTISDSRLVNGCGTQEFWTSDSLWF